MANKLVIGILVVLVLYAASIGFYTFSLNSTIDRLEEQFSSFEITQTDRMDALDAGFIELQNETQDRLVAMEKTINEAVAGFDAWQEDILDTVNTVNEQIMSVADNVDALGKRLSTAEEELSYSLINTAGIYQQVVGATVQISDGELIYGSGVIMDEEGHVLTAHHVVDVLTDIYVVLHDGRVSRATLVGESALSDIAVLGLDISPGIQPPPFADSSQSNIGDAVIAVGSPVDSDTLEDLNDTLTSGIISQVNRYVKIDGSYIPNLIQFDAPVNPGNSGGPLFNSDGEIVGIVIARIAATEGDGISFAVSSNKAKRVAAEILENGFFDHPWLGVIIDDLDPGDLEDLGLENINGVYILGVFNDSPAEASGLAMGDIIISVDGTMIRDKSDLTSYLAENNSPGDTITIIILRDDTTIEITVELDSRPE